MKFPTDEEMLANRQATRPYTAVILTKTAKRAANGADAIVWEHGRRNYALRAAGKLAIVCPIRDDSDLSGIAIFTGGLDEVREIMEDDPGVRAGIFTYELHETRSFPGDALPTD